ncbi:hypothetical protein [Actinomadura rifamycini]|uniref:hypothetical protein n=1 Tax=Actinomadura rifamycini TaxID=31962 RepID=UPI00041144C5|nr:hypothetical protein [Actinomadura rifamycini]
MRFAVPVAALTLAFSVSACGGDSEDGAGDGASSAPPPTAASSGPAATPSQGGSGGGSMTGNGGGGGSMTGNGGGSGSGGAGQTSQQKMLAKVVECMRAKGYDMPDPEPGNPAVAPRNTEGKDPNKVNADSQECVQKAQAG